MKNYSPHLTHESQNNISILKLFGQAYNNYKYLAEKKIYRLIDENKQKMKDGSKHSLTTV